MKLFICILSLCVSGQLAAQNVGIGNNLPTERLEVTGNIKADTQKVNVIRIVNGAGISKSLVSDAAGNASWVLSNSLPGAVNYTSTVNGPVSGAIPTVANVWEFYGPSINLFLNGNQRVVMNGFAGLGKSTAGSLTFDIDLGYQLQPGGSVTNFSGFNYVEITPTVDANSRSSYPISGSVKPPAGVYKFGYVIRASVVNYFNDNDFVNGYIMIINE